MFRGWLNEARWRAGHSSYWLYQDKNRKGPEMSIKLRISPLLSRYIDNQRIVEVNGDTVDECLKHLEKQFSKLKLFEKDGRLLSYLNIYINKELISRKELDKPVKDGDEIYIMLMIGGG